MPSIIDERFEGYPDWVDANEPVILELSTQEESSYFDHLSELAAEEAEMAAIEAAGVSFETRRCEECGEDTDFAVKDGDFAYCTWHESFEMSQAMTRLGVYE